MTVKEMRNEIDRMKQGIYRTLDFETRKAIMYRQMELMDRTGINVTSRNGVQKYYLTKSASKKQVDDYLTTLINAQYDVIGRCL